MNFRDAETFFCFVPVDENPEWFVVSIIPAAILQKNGIIARKTDETIFNVCVVKRMFVS
ncbi:hypothetical protein [Eisenbergiella sp.]